MGLNIGGPPKTPTWFTVLCAVGVVAILALYAYGWMKCAAYKIGDMPGICLALVSK